MVELVITARVGPQAQPTQADGHRRATTTSSAVHCEPHMVSAHRASRLEKARPHRGHDLADGALRRRRSAAQLQRSRLARTARSAAGDNGHWPSLASALADLARTLGVTEGTLAISLDAAAHRGAPPRVSAGRETTICSACWRATRRAISSARERRRSSARRSPARRVRGAPAPVVAAAAPARLVAAIRNAAAADRMDRRRHRARGEVRGRAAALALWPVVRATAVVRARRARRSHRPPADRRRTPRRRAPLPRRRAMTPR